MLGRDVSWDDIRIFLEYLRSGSVSHAAKALKISSPTVSRRINALQEALGFPLLNRSAQGLELAESARTLVEIWQDAEKLLINAPKLASRMQSHEIELRFSTTPALASALIFPNIHKYFERWPNIKFDIDTSFRLIDIGAGQGDIALRFVEPERGAVIRQRVGTITFNVFCSEAILPDGIGSISDWQGLCQTGVRAITWVPEACVSMPQKKLQDVLGSNRTGIAISEYSGLIDAIRNGLGAGILPDIVGRRLTGVRAMMTPGVVGETPLWLVTADRLSGYRHVSEFRVFIREAIQRETAAIAKMQDAAD
ncbi:LysR family transcriptional regulator [Polycladidibacter stylochi]|uniref:LysR family transcriptional regulator n=1 Tax=Polycladidibacter stylochi TaxID=1807766 RepID=UPI00082FDB83|nr:LysR family transcriptional regulator [Pseudovibrio stylochi]